MGDECTICACTEIGDSEELLVITGGLGGGLLRRVAGCLRTSPFVSTLTGLASRAAPVQVCRCGEEKSALACCFRAGFGGGMSLDERGGRLLDTGMSWLFAFCCTGTGGLPFCLVRGGSSMSCALDREAAILLLSSVTK